MLVSSFNLSQSFNYTPYLFYKKTVQIRDRFFLYMDHELSAWEEGKARTHEINIKKGYARNVINLKESNAEKHASIWDAKFRDELTSWAWAWILWCLLSLASQGMFALSCITFSYQSSGIIYSLQRKSTFSILPCNYHQK